MADDLTTEPTLAKQRSPTFPYIPLDMAIERVKLIYSKIKDHPQNRDQIAKAYGKPATSSATIQTLATLQQYGLLENVNQNSERRLRVTQLARTLIHPNVPIAIYEESLKRSALLPQIFQELWERFKDLDGLSDHVPLYYLSHDREADRGSVFTEGAAKDVLRVYRATLAFAGISASDKTDDAEEAVDEWEAAAPTGSQRQPEEELVVHEPHLGGQAPALRVTAPITTAAGSLSDTLNIPEGLVVLSFPDGFSQESLNDIEAWLDFQKNRLKRWVRTH